MGHRTLGEVNACPSSAVQLHRQRHILKHFLHGSQKYTAVVVVHINSTVAEHSDLDQGKPRSITRHEGTLDGSRGLNNGSRRGALPKHTYTLLHTAVQQYICLLKGHVGSMEHERISC